jgi:hypothetical protein
MEQRKDPEQERAEIREELSSERGAEDEESLEDARSAPPGFMGRVLRDDRDRTGRSNG